MLERRASLPFVVLVVAIVLSVGRLGDLRPFGLALFFASLGAPPAISAAAAVGTVAGSAIASNAPEALITLAAVAVGWALGGPVTSGRLRGVSAGWLAAGAIVSAQLASAGNLSARTPLWWIQALAGLSCTVWLTWLWRPLVERLVRPGASETSSPAYLEAGTAAVAAVAALLLGLQGIGFGPVQPAALLGPWTVLVAGSAVGPMAAMATGASIGFLLPLSDSRWLLYGLAMTAGGLLGAAYGDDTRRRSSALMVASVAVACLAAPSRAWVTWALTYGSLGSLAFVLTPSWLLARVEAEARSSTGHAEGAGVRPPAAPGSPVPLTAVSPAWPQAGPRGVAGTPLAADWLAEGLTGTLEGLGGMVRALAATYESAPALFPGTSWDGVAYVEQVQERACAQCPSFSHCWEEHANDSLWDVVAFLDQAEREGKARPAAMPAGLAERCIQQARLCAAVDSVVAVVRAVRAVERRAQGEGRRLLAQLRAAEGVIQEAAGCLERRRRSLDGAEAARIARHLARAGWRVRDVVAGGEGARREVLVELASCRGGCDVRIPRLVSEAAGGTWRASTEGSQAAGGQAAHGPGCRLRLQRAPGWALDTAVMARTRTGQDACGDAVRRLDLAPALSTIILSDGMGSGPEASRESVAAVELAASSLEAGVPAGRAIGLVNAVLLARSRGDRFATLDVALIDLASGQMELAKAGSYPTLLCRAGTVEHLEGRAVPAGIVEGIEIETIKRPLADGDMIAMMTDGVAELGPGAEETVEAVMAAAVTGHDPPAADVARSVMDALERAGRGTWPDDLTLVVAKAHQLDVSRMPTYTEGGSGWPARAVVVGRQHPRRSEERKSTRDGRPALRVLKGD